MKDQQNSDQTQPIIPDKPKFDVTGTFYWCEPRSYEDVILVSNLKSFGLEGGKIDIG